MDKSSQTRIERNCKYLFTYVRMSGTPAGEQAFRERVKQNMNNRYPELLIISQDVRYSYVDMGYHSTVRIQNGVEIEVSVGYDNELQDNYNR